MHTLDEQELEREPSSNSCQNSSEVLARLDSDCGGDRLSTDLIKSKKQLPCRGPQLIAHRRRPTRRLTSNTHVLAVRSGVVKASATSGN